MTKTKTNQLELIDMYLSAFLALHSVPPRLILKNGKVLFVFDATDEVYRLMAVYNGNPDVPCLDMVTAVVTLRGKTLTTKEGTNRHSLWRAL